jgi:hypothetical protein
VIYYYSNHDRGKTEYIQRDTIHIDIDLDDEVDSDPVEVVDPGQPKKIAFLFLIYDKINHENVWKTFFRNADPRLYNIYVHYKENVTTSFDRHKLKHAIPTAWGDKSLVQAHNLLLKEALKDRSNTHFILVSNSCVPFKTFDHIYRWLDEKYSYYNMFVKFSSPERRVFAEPYVDAAHTKKAHQWSILNRKHAKMVTSTEVYLTWFPYIPDEHAHITYLFHKKMGHELKLTYDEKENATTYTNWSADGTTLFNFTTVTNKLIDQLCESDCLFGRKFTKECDLTYLESKLRM